MSTNKYFSENWIVVFGIVLILVTYYKYENDPHAKNNSSDKKEAAATTEKQVSNNSVKTDTERTPAAQPDETSNPQKADGFNSSDKFNRAINHRDSKIPVQNFNNISLNHHNLLQSTSWKLWLNTRVVKNSDLAEDNQVLASVSNLSIVEAQDDADLSQFDTSKQAVVFDERLKKPGIITGVLKVQTSNKARLKEDLKNWQAEVSDEFDSIQTYFVKSQNKVFNLEALYENLKSQDYITDVELEILSRGYNKN